MRTNHGGDAVMRKTIRRFMMVTLSFLMLLFCNNALAAKRGKYGDNLTWEINKGVLTISGTGPMAGYGLNESPWWFERDFDRVVIEEGVTTIGQSAFFQQMRIVSVSIPDSVTSIEDYAFFRCENMREINIPENVTHIGTDAFAGCISLESPIPTINTVSEKDVTSETAENSESGLLAGCSYKIIESPDGFTFPLFFGEDDGTVNSDAWGDNWAYYSNPGFVEPSIRIVQSCYNDISPRLYEEEDILRTWHIHINNYWDCYYPFAEEEHVVIDGYPARLVIWNANGTDKYLHVNESVGQVIYFRNDRALICQLASWDDNGEIKVDDLPKVTMADLRKIAKLISYDPTKAPYTVADGEFSVRTKRDQSIVSAGGKLKVTAEYHDEKKMMAKKKDFDWYWNNIKPTVTSWSVVDMETGKEIPGVEINNSGNLTVDRKLESVYRAEIRGENTFFLTKAACPITIIPASSKIFMDTTKAFFYTGTDTPRTVRAVIEPETVPVIGLSWKAQREGIVELADNGDGSVTLTPVGTGKTIVMVTDPNGKKAKLDVSVTDPVVDMELKVKGKAKPGSSVTINAVFNPATAGNKDAEWSLDVGEDVATVNNKGQVKISKGAPAGTKITVSCKALGAPEPVTKTIEIDVVEK